MIKEMKEILDQFMLQLKSKTLHLLWRSLIIYNVRTLFTDQVPSLFNNTIFSCFFMVHVRDSRLYLPLWKPVELIARSLNGMPSANGASVNVGRETTECRLLLLWFSPYTSVAIYNLYRFCSRNVYSFYGVPYTQQKPTRHQWWQLVCVLFIFLLYLLKNTKIELK